MKKIKIILIVLILLLIFLGLYFKCAIKINTYNKPGFTIEVDKYVEGYAEKRKKYYELKDFESLKKLDYEAVDFFDFGDDDAICEYYYANNTVIYEGDAKERNIYAVVCNKKIKYIRGKIGLYPSIEDRYDFDKEKKEWWLTPDIREMRELELSDSQYSKIVNLLKLLKFFHKNSDTYDFNKIPMINRNVLCIEGKYYDFDDDNKLICNIIEMNLGNYLKELLYEDSDFKYYTKYDFEYVW